MEKRCVPITARSGYAIIVPLAILLGKRRINKDNTVQDREAYEHNPFAEKEDMLTIKLQCYLKIFIVFVIASCSLSIPVKAHEQDPANITEVVAVFPENFPPQYFIDDNGKPAGFAIDVLKQVAQRANLRVVYRPVENWVVASNLLQNGTADLIPNSGVTAKRLLENDYTFPVETFTVVIFVRKMTSV